MKTVKFTSWQDGDFFIGFLNDYPDYATQGMSKEELAENLKDLWADLAAGLPIYPIQTEAEYDHAVQVLNELLDAGGANENHELAQLVTILRH